MLSVPLNAPVLKRRLGEDGALVLLPPPPPPPPPLLLLRPLPPLAWSSSGSMRVLCGRERPPLLSDSAAAPTGMLVGSVSVSCDEDVAGVVVVWA